MKNPEIPVAGIGRGPGSQPAEADGAELAYLAMPKTMNTYSPPLFPCADEAPGREAAIGQLRELLDALYRYRPGAAPCVIDLVGLGPDERGFLEDALGEGEVSARFEDGDATAKVQETRLAGVWRLRARGFHGGVQRDTLEVADVPAMLRHRAFDPAAGRVEIGGRIPRGVVNAPPVLVELADRAAAWKVGNPPHVVNLTLLPQTAEDLDFLRSRLGTGNVTLLSRGYGNCRVTATGLRNVWWVQYFNSEDALILNTLEVADIPAVALAAPEDIEDSAERLAEILETVA